MEPVQIVTVVDSWQKWFVTLFAKVDLFAKVSLHFALHDFACMRTMVGALATAEQLRTSARDRVMCEHPGAYIVITKLPKVPAQPGH